MASRDSGRFTHELRGAGAADETAAEQHDERLLVIPPPPYHHHALHPTNPSGSSTSPPSYPPSRSTSPPPPPPPAEYLPHGDSLVPFLSALLYLSSGALTGWAVASTARYAGRTLVASAALTSLTLAGLGSAGLAEVRWAAMWQKGWDWVEANGRAGDGLWSSLRSAWQRRTLQPADGGAAGEEGVERRGAPQSGDFDDSVDRVMRAAEAVGLRLLTTASGVGFSLGIIYALRK